MPVTITCVMPLMHHNEVSLLSSIDVTPKGVLSPEKCGSGTTHEGP